MKKLIRAAQDNSNASESVDAVLDWLQNDLNLWSTIFEVNGKEVRFQDPMEGTIRHVSYVEARAGLIINIDSDGITDSSIYVPSTYRRYDVNNEPNINSWNGLPCISIHVEVYDGVISRFLFDVFFSYSSRYFTKYAGKGRAKDQKEIDLTDYYGPISIYNLDEIDKNRIYNMIYDVLETSDARMKDAINRYRTSMKKQGFDWSPEE